MKFEAVRIHFLSEVFGETRVRSKEQGIRNLWTARKMWQVKEQRENGKACYAG